MHDEEVAPSTSIRKKRYKSSFRYSTMKELQNASEYKRSSKKDSSDPNNVKKTLKFLKRLLKMSETIMECNEQEGLRTPISQ
jgi:hypothetical protein